MAEHEGTKHNVIVQGTQLIKAKRAKSVSSGADRMFRHETHGDYERRYRRTLKQERERMTMLKNEGV